MRVRELTKRAEELGFRVIHDDTWGYVLWRNDYYDRINPHTQSNKDLDDLREIIAGIEWGREHGTAQTG